MLSPGIRPKTPDNPKSTSFPLEFRQLNVSLQDDQEILDSARRRNKLHIDE